MESRQRAQVRRWLHTGPVAALIWLALLIAPGGASAILADASCPGPSDAAPLGYAGDRAEAQTFAAVHTGALQRATVTINNLASDTNFVVQILATDSNGTPVNGALASATVQNGSVPVGPATLDVTFTPGANVVAGSQYAVAISRPGANFILPTWQIQTRTPASCPGSSFFNTGPNQGWAAEPADLDLIFQTFVNPANKFSLVGKKGRLFIRVPGPGDLRVKGTKLVRKAHATARAAGDVPLRLKLTARAVRHVLRTRRLNLPVFITFTPGGGDPNTEKFKIKIRI